MNNMRLRVATYNIHDGVGRDRRYDPMRIVNILCEINADVLALQEVTLDHAGEFKQCFASTGMQVTDGTVFEHHKGHYGNLLLTRQPVIATPYP